MDIEMVWKFLVTVSILLHSWTIYKAVKRIDKLEK